MAISEPDFPPRHTTTTITSSTMVQTNLRFDPSYLKTLPGILKCIPICSSLLGFIAVQLSGPQSYHSVGSAFYTLDHIAFWCTGILLIFYLFHVIEKYYKMPWLRLEFIFCLVMAILVGSVSIAAFTVQNAFYDVAGVFGILCMAAYALDSFLKYRGLRAGKLAQGERVSYQTTTTTQ